MYFDLQLKKENNNIDLSIPPMRLGEKEVTHEAGTITLRKAIRLNRVIQASDGHWAAENAGPMNDDGGWGFYIEGHSTMIGSAINYVALHLLGEGPDDGEEGATTKARQWILDNGSVTGIPSSGKTYLSVKLTQSH
ncbi:Dammarenediol II synthase [Camellia lanceoleosa]|uniref:Dammarenediol II synthase n=1 Tax=Camellia lanceoleosa TaxID=1840588 RepID=A0ACC0GGE9_9ERIC|nr:Dammarenediol II synthase [Camellia lanceoleosa]